MSELAELRVPAPRRKDRETLAAAIYEKIPHDGRGHKPAWVSGGNSFKQDEARMYADAVLGICAPRQSDIEAICRDYAARWFGKDWSLMDDDDEAKLRIQAHRWLKCWEAVTSSLSEATND